MNSSTVTAAPKSSSATRGVELTSGGRAHTAHGAHALRSRREVGTSRLRDARRDLSMFAPPDAPAPTQPPARGEWLDPLLAPVRSAPPRHPHLAGLRIDRADATAPRDHGRVGSAHVVRDPLVGAGPADPQPASPQRRRLLTTRGYVAVLGLLAGAIATCSAITVGQSEAVPTIQTTQVVARGGESIEGLANRSAQGRDVQAVAESIRVANGLTAGELPEAGEVLIVPGS